MRLSNCLSSWSDFCLSFTASCLFFTSLKLAVMSVTLSVDLNSLLSTRIRSGMFPPWFAVMNAIMYPCCPASSFSIGTMSVTAIPSPVMIAPRFSMLASPVLVIWMLSWVGPILVVVGKILLMLKSMVSFCSFGGFGIGCGGGCEGCVVFCGSGSVVSKGASVVVFVVAFVVVLGDVSVVFSSACANILNARIITRSVGIFFMVSLIEFYPMARLTSMHCTELMCGMVASCASSSSVLPRFSSITNMIISALRPKATGCISVLPTSQPNVLTFSLTACSSVLRSTSGDSGMIFMVMTQFAMLFSLGLQIRMHGTRILQQDVGRLCI